MEPSTKQEPHAAPKRRLLEGKRILLIDDSPGIRLLFSRLLERDGANVTTSVAAEPGIDLALGGSFDLVLMDLEMPDMGGVEAASKLREKGFRGPLLAFSGHSGDAEVVERLRQAGFSGLLQKDGASLELTKQLAGWL